MEGVYELDYLMIIRPSIPRIPSIPSVPSILAFSLHLAPFTPWHPSLHPAPSIAPGTLECTRHPSLTASSTLHCRLRSSSPPYSTGIFRSCSTLPQLHSANRCTPGAAFDTLCTTPLRQHLHYTRHPSLHAAPFTASSAPVHHSTLQVSSAAIPSSTLLIHALPGLASHLHYTRVLPALAFLP